MHQIILLHDFTSTMELQLHASARRKVPPQNMVPCSTACGASYAHKICSEKNKKSYCPGPE